MNVHVLQHVPFEGIAGIEPWLQQRGASITHTRFFAGELPPAAGTVDRLIVMGGPMSVHDEEALPWLRAEKAFVAEVIRRGGRVLGICLGAQLVAEVLGGTVTRNREREIGWFPVTRVAGAGTHRLGRVFPETFEPFHWHGETFSIPKGAVHLLRSAACERQAFAYGDRVLAMQFHVETTATSARALAENAADELAAGGSYVQTAKELLAKPERYAAIAPVLDAVLDAVIT